MRFGSGPGRATQAVQEPERSAHLVGGRARVRARDRVRVRVRVRDRVGDRVRIRIGVTYP